MEEILKDLFRIEVPLANNPLRATNAYFIRGDESDLLIDTGFRTEDCLSSIKESLSRLGADAKRLDILITHLHSDHSGLCDVICGPGRHIYMHLAEYDYEMSLPREEMFERVWQRLSLEGYPAEYAANRKKAEYVRADYTSGKFVTVTEDDVIKVGDYALRPVSVSGHTPGNMMLYDEKRKLMFTGDHILFGITPNITAFPGIKDGLGDYLKNLKKADGFDVVTALPGHRETGDYHKRIAGLLEHHRKRLAETEGIVADGPGMNAYEVASRMKWHIRADSWETFPFTQKWFAMGECISHLNHLLCEERIYAVPDEKGTRRYYKEDRQ